LNVNCRRRVITHQHNAKPRRPSGLAGKVHHPIVKFLTNLTGNRRTFE
jgi:hypothetical protein